MNLIKRVIVAIIFIPLILFIFYKAGIYLFGFLSIIVLLQNYELNLMTKQSKVTTFFNILFSLIIFYTFSFKGTLFITFSLFLIIFYSFFVDLIENRMQGALKRASFLLFIPIYTAAFLSSLIKISHFEHGNYLILTLLILIWITDTFAYFAGVSFGRHRGIFPASPNKSLEGFLAGIFFAFIFGYIFSRLGFISIKEAMIASVSAGIFGQLGDLFESVIKRDFGVKDSSNLIPGHGGILDRFDSILIAAPIYYFLLKLL